MLLLALLLAAARPALAGDGAIDWRTLQGPCLEVHYPAPLEPLARRAAAVFEDARRTLQPLFGYQPDEPMQLTIDDFADSANGFATPYPYDHVHLYAYPPEPGGDLGDHGDWLRALLFHEYAHILHLGDVSGLPAAGNWVFGRRFLPNMLLPRFFVEGLATHIETRHTGQDRAVAGQGGRVGSPVYLAMLRAAVLDGTLPELHHLTGQPLRWPRGNGWYLFGGVLLDDIARTRGHEAIRKFLKDYGTRVIAYGVQGVSRSAFGASLSRLWQDARQHVAERVHGEIQAGTGSDSASSEAAWGDGRRLTRDGEWRGRVRSWPDGASVVVAHAPKDAFQRIERIDIATAKSEVLHRCQLDCDEPLVTPDGRWLLFTESRRLRRVYSYREIVAVRLGRGAHTKALQLTSGLRARAPSIDPSGRWLVTVAVRAGRAELHLLDLQAALTVAEAGATSEARVLWQGTGIGDLVSSPVLPGDGRLYWTHGSGGQRHLWSAPIDLRRALLGDATRHDALARVAGSDALLRLHMRGTQDVAVPWLDDLQPFACGTHTCLGAIVQTGTFRDAGYLDLQAPEQGWHLSTRTLTGLTSTTHAAGRAISVRYGGWGMDVWAAPPSPLTALGGAVPLQPTAGSGQEAAPVPLLPPSAGEGMARSAGDEGYAPPATHLAEQPYNPLPTLRPRSWAPILLATGDNPDLLRGGLWLGATTTGQDALEHWQLQLTGQFRSSGTDPILFGSLRATRWEPQFDLSGGYQQGNAWFLRGYRWRTAPTDRLGVRLGGNWTIPHLRDSWNVSAAWRVVRSTLRNPYQVSSIAQEPEGHVPYGPWTGLDALLDVGIGYGYAESYPDSIETERLHTASLHASVSDRWTGGGRQRVVVDLSSAHRWPLGKRRVLALDGNLSLIPIGQAFGPGYSIRGVLPFLAMDLLGGGAGGGATVRGAGSGGDVLGGNGLSWGTAALHLPVWDIGRGIEVLPVHAGRLSAVGFCDWAWAFWTPPGWGIRGGGMLSLGGELRLNYELGYIPLGVLRLGVAHAFGELGGTQGYFAVGL